MFVLETYGLETPMPCPVPDVGLRLLVQRSLFLIYVIKLLFEFHVRSSNINYSSNIYCLNI